MMSGDVASAGWIEEALGRVPRPGRSKLAGRLEDPAHHLTAYHELAVGAILQASGLCPEYEMEFPEGTPDWSAGEPNPLLVEVWSRRQPDAVRKSEAAWLALRQEVAAIPAPWSLRVAAMPPGRPHLRPPTLDEARVIRQRVQAWLLSTVNPVRPGSRLQASGFVFEVVQAAPGMSALIHTPTGGGWVTSDVILANVREKLDRYSTLARRLGAPLLVVVAGEKNSGIGKDQVVSALTGVQTITVSLDPMPMRGQDLGQVRVRNWTNNQLAQFDSALSAVAWLEDSGEGPGQLTVWPIEGATLRLPVLSAPWVVHERLAAGSPRPDPASGVVDGRPEGGPR